MVNRRRLMWRICGTAVAAAAVLGLAACGPSGPPKYTGPVTDADVVGSWKSNCGAHLVLAAGGEATVTNMPIAWSSGEGRPTKFYNGTTKWWLITPPVAGLQLELNEIYSLDYVTTNGGLGFSFDLMSYDYGDDAFCVFSRAGVPGDTASAHWSSGATG